MLYNSENDTLLFSRDLKSKTALFFLHKINKIKKSC